VQRSTNLTNLKDCEDRDQEVRQIDAHIQYLVTWNELRGRSESTRPAGE